MQVQNSAVFYDTFHSSSSYEKLSVERSSKVITSVEGSSIDRKMADGILERVMATSGATVEYTYKEQESLEFGLSAKVIADDKEHTINLSLNLTREFITKNKIDIQSAIFTDPLIINVDGQMPEITDERMMFDIDADGELDQISKLASGSYFLSLDKDNSGHINDGSELFGALSGDGFAQLMQYDDDQNGWIDENDKVFEGLRLWSGDANGKKLVALGEAGIGAIYLGATQADFTYKNEDNTSLASMKKLSFGLKNDGKAAMIAQIDFAKFRQETPMQNSEQTAQTQNSITEFSFGDILGVSKEGSDESFEEILEKQVEQIQKNVKKLKTKLYKTNSIIEEQAIKAQIAALEALASNLSAMKAKVS